MKVLNMKKLILFLSLFTVFIDNFSSTDKKHHAKKLTPNQAANLDQEIRNNDKITDLLLITTLASCFISIDHRMPTLRLFNHVLGGVSLGGFLVLTARSAYLQGHSIKCTRPMTFNGVCVDSKDCITSKLGNTNFLNHFENTMALK
jgi:hypothetical protein